MVKRVLMIAFHYPPVKGSSGVHRTLKFSQYLPELGWEPIILTVHPRAYEGTSSEQMHEIPDSVKVHRAFALDTRKHLGVAGIYPKRLALPDRWVSWTLGAIPTGLRLIKKYQPQVIWSTYPIATALLIGLALQRKSRLPWVVDFRDTMVDEDYPPKGLTRRAYEWVEKNALVHCTKAVFTSPSAIDYIRSKYPALTAAQCALIPNGYDEENFANLPPRSVSPREQQVLVHSGTLYPSERDPSAFFRALAGLLGDGKLDPARVKIVLRATGHDEYLANMIAKFGIGSLVFLAPPIPYAQALSEMMDADGLILMQAANCNRQIPAKLYEYLRARRPVLALTDPAGDTAKELLGAGLQSIARIDDEADIRRKLMEFLEDIRANTTTVMSAEMIQNYSRHARTKQLAGLLDSVISTR